MNKLIKLSENHYIVVDDSEIKEGDFYLNIASKDIDKSCKSTFIGGLIPPCYKKITHSTQPLNKSFNDWFDVQIISLSEVEEAIYGYSVEKMVKEHIHNRWKNADNPNAFNSSSCEKDYLSGFKAHQELVKDKLFTVDDMRKALWDLGDVLFNNNQHGIKEGEPETHFNDIIESLLPKTEWDIEFDEQGKIKLI